MIGIIFAMEEELSSFLNLVKVDKVNKIYDLTFYEITINNRNVVLVISGVGKVNAARACQILIDKYNVKGVINVGVAGGVSENLAIGDIVIGERLVQHDFDITAFNHEKGYISNVGMYLSSSKKLITLIEKIMKKEKITYYKGVIASGDIFITEEKMSKKIKNKFQALCVEMEGASIAQVCFLSHIPFLVLRSISDIPNNQNVITYENFLKESSMKINKILLKILYEM